jgi:hypothetical protein
MRTQTINPNGQGLQFSGTPYELGSGVESRPELRGFAAVSREASSQRNRRIMAAARLYADALKGRIEPMFMREAMSPTREIFVQHLAERYPGLYGDPGGRQLGLRETMARTDYQALFVDVLDRLYYGYYSMWPIVQKQLVRIKQLRDFRVVKRYLLDGMVAPVTYRDPAEPFKQSALQPPVPQDGATFAAGTNAPAITYQPLLGQTGDAINWAAFVNDDLGIFQDVAQRLAIAANRGISRFITGKFVETSGPNTALYTSGYANRITIANGAQADNPPLGIEGLSDGFDILFGMKDSQGEPIMVADATIYLYYGSNNEVTAQNLAHMISVYVTNRGGGANATPATGYPQQLLQTGNWLIQRVKPVMDPYVNVIASDKPKTWALVVDPNRVNRPCVEIGFLNGFEEPQLFQKVPNTMRMGGGVDAIMGDFYTMDQEMKIISVIGGSAIDGRTTVASDGSGS